MEYIDIFDENNNPTREIKEKTKAHEEGNFHRTAHIWIMNDKKELLLQKSNTIKDYIFEDNEVSEVKYVYFEDLEKMVANRVEGLLIHEEEYKKIFEFIRKNY